MTHRRKPKNVTGPMADNLFPDGRRGLQLSVLERQLIERRKKAQLAATLFLDMDAPNRKRTYKSIAEELGISVHALKDLTKTPEFEEAWNNLYVAVQDHPFYLAAKAKLVDLLPQALQTLESALSTGGWTTRLKAAEYILKVGNVMGAAKDASEKKEAMIFLQQNNIQVGEIPPEYQEALEGQFTEPVQTAPPALADPIEEMNRRMQGATLQEVIAAVEDAANAEEVNT